MTIVNVRLLSAGETASILRKALGPRQWSDFLADAIRGKCSGIQGQVLMPHARGPRRVPLYLPADVIDFIRQARRLDPSLSPQPFTSTVYQADDTIGLHWRTRRATPAAMARRAA